MIVCGSKIKEILFNLRLTVRPYLWQMNKMACITGATSGFGRAIALMMAENSWDLCLIGRRAYDLKEVAVQCEAMGVKVWTKVVDVRVEEEVIQFVADMRQHFPSIDVLVNNAGLAVGKDPIQNGLTEDWDRMLDTNVKGLLWMSREVSQWMIEKKKGTIVNIGSIAGKQAYPGGSVYCASKFAVDAITQSMRFDLLPHGIRVGQVCPGAAETEFSKVRFKGDEGIAADVYKGYIPLSANDVAEAVYFILSRPEHVSIHDIIIMPSVQASATVLNKQL
jgi:NADP-dependent 3-hydroxy acid dehydrogenase YdfG